MRMYTMGTSFINTTQSYLRDTVPDRMQGKYPSTDHRDPSPQSTQNPQP